MAQIEASTITPEEAINIIQSHLPNLSLKHKEAFTYAIDTISREIPVKPIIEKWCPTVCPACGEELSVNLGDGYYQNSDFLERCSNVDCNQRLDWEK